MSGQKNTVVYVAVAIVSVVLIGIVGIILLLSGGSDEASSVEQTSTATKTAPIQDLPVEPIGIEKDSILKSTDSGASFETYFRVGTTKDLGVVDVLNIAFYPNAKDKMVVSTYDDGLFYNEAQVNNWRPIDFPPQKIMSFILDKSDPENRSFASGVVSGNGRIFRTEDGGVTWRVVYAEPGINTFVSSITQDPRNSNIIIAGTNAGTLVRSVDAGDTWKNIGQKISGYIDKFAHDSKKASFQYLLVRGGKLYHSYDAGVTWLNWEEEKAKEIKDLNARAAVLTREGNKDGAKYLKDQATAIQTRNKTEKTPTGIISITPDPTVSGVLYASLSKGLYRSTDFGKYWKLINIIESAEKFPIPSVAINPFDTNEISFVAGNSFYRSINYGVTWAITPLDKTRNASFVSYDPFDGNTIFIGLSAKK